MMDSCLNNKPENVGSITVEDLRKDLFAEFSKLSRVTLCIIFRQNSYLVRIRF